MVLLRVLWTGIGKCPVCLASGVKMAIDAIRHRSSRLDNAFFLSMAILILATVFLGFARTYYLAGKFRAPLPTWSFIFTEQFFPFGSCCSSHKARLLPAAGKTTPSVYATPFRNLLISAPTPLADGRPTI